MGYSEAIVDDYSLGSDVKCSESVVEELEDGRHVYRERSAELRVLFFVLKELN